MLRAFGGTASVRPAQEFAKGTLLGLAERIAKMPEDDWRRRAPQFKEPKLSRNLKLVELLSQEVRAMRDVIAGPASAPN